MFCKLERAKVEVHVSLTTLTNAYARIALRRKVETVHGQVVMSNMLGLITFAYGYPVSPSCRLNTPQGPRHWPRATLIIT